MAADNLQVMLGVSGERDLGEKLLKSLTGYNGWSPVRTGNGTWNQLQQILHFVYSKMRCWIALDRAVRIADSLGEEEDANRFAMLRDKIKETVIEKGYDQTKGSFVRSFGSKELDAANLLTPQVRFIDPKDPKMVSTLNQTMKELTENGFLRRYNANDGLKCEEGAFLVCSFWLVSCLALAGRLEDAEKLFDSLLGYSNHLGLFSEEIDPKSGQMLGNFPQAFTHMGRISAAVQLAKTMDERDNQHMSP